MSATASQIAHLLRRLTIGKDIFNDDIKFTEVVLAKPISVPTNSLQQHALNAIYGQVEGHVPFWVEILADSRSGLFCVSEINNEVLLSSAITILLEALGIYRHSRDHWCHFCLLRPDFLPSACIH